MLILSTAAMRPRLFYEILPSCNARLIRPTLQCVGRLTDDKSDVNYLTVCQSIDLLSMSALAFLSVNSAQNWKITVPHGMQALTFAKA